MLSAFLRKPADPALARAAGLLAARGVGADGLTMLGFAIGLAAIPVIAKHYYLAGLVLLFLNRLCDALDGAVARRTQATGRGAYLDRTLDLIVFAGLPFAFALADPARALAATFFVFAIAASGAAALIFAVPASRQDSRRDTALGYLGRLMEDTELTLAFAVACIMPGWFSLIAYIGGALCFVAAGACIAAAVAGLDEP